MLSSAFSGTNDRPGASDEQWHAEMFDDAETVTSFMNHVGLGSSQLVSLQMQALSSTAQRLLLVCRLTPQQLEARVQWQAVERTLHPVAVTIATGGGH